MTGVSIARGRDTQGENHHVVTKVPMHEYVCKTRDPKDQWQTRGGGRGKEGSSLLISERAQLCQHLDFTLLASRTVRQGVPVVLRPQLVLFGNSSFRKQMHRYAAFRTVATGNSDQDSFPRAALKTPVCGNAARASSLREVSSIQQSLSITSLSPVSIKSQKNPLEC